VSKADDMLAMMPPYLTSDPLVIAIMQAFGGEYQRIEDAQSAVSDAAFPSQANDELLPTGAMVTLAQMWETLLGLPVNPVGVTILERRAKICAQIQTRTAGSGSDWVATLTAALGATPWSYEEGPGDYQVTIFIPHDVGSYSAEQLLILARKITPAHIDIVPAYDTGFLIGISDIGIEPL
jgi:uncharacterized protein YmfQ (DUF2313 family)